VLESNTLTPTTKDAIANPPATMKVAVSSAISRLQRLEPLDVFRGLTIAGMIVVPMNWQANTRRAGIREGA